MNNKLIFRCVILKKNVVESHFDGCKFLPKTNCMNIRCVVIRKTYSTVLYCEKPSI